MGDGIVTDLAAAAAKTAYNAGWRAYRSCVDPCLAIEMADKRRAPKAWYIGFYDADAGVEKYASLGG